MTKKKKINYFSKSNIIIGLVVVFIFGGLAVNANVSFIDKITDRAGEILGFGLLDRIKGDINLEEEEEVMGGTMSEKWVKQGNRVTYIESGEFRDATTTLFAFINPFGSATSTDDAWNSANSGAIDKNTTSTVVSINLDITGVATSTFELVCGGSTDAYSSPTYDLLYAIVPTSTPVVISNNMATTTHGYHAIGGGLTAKVLLTQSYSYFVCYASGTPDTTLWGQIDDADGVRKGITGSNNTFDGTWSVEVQKNLQ